MDNQEGKINIYLSLGKSQGTQWDTQCDTKSPKNELEVNNFSNHLQAPYEDFK